MLEINHVNRVSVLNLYISFSYGRKVKEKVCPLDVFDESFVSKRLLQSHFVSLYKSLSR